MSLISIQALLQHHGKQLEDALRLDSSCARIEAQCLLQAVLKVDRSYLFAHSDQPLNAAQHARYMALFERRIHGEPIAYLLASREFYGLNFRVSPATLIPRPETELLVELALQRIPSLPNPPNLPLWAQGSRRLVPCCCAVSLAQSGEERVRNVGATRILDLGTGSGVIALSIAHTRPDTEIVAVDASQSALDVARENAHRLNIGNVIMLQSDWFAELHDEHFDLIVSNPPYVAESDIHLEQGDLRFEPRVALVSGTDGLDDIRRICSQARAHLNHGGWLLMEHGYDQAARVRTLLQQAGFAGVFSAQDIAGIERVSGGIIR
ncbi:MAG: peptide chain release factor N(5)-glutamine methyltransferase [Gallionella sp.]